MPLAGDELEGVGRKEGIGKGMDPPRRMTRKIGKQLISCNCPDLRYSISHHISYTNAPNSDSIVV